MKNLFLLSCMLIAFSSCEEKNPQAMKQTQVLDNNSQSELKKINDFGNGVYYFQCSGAEFAVELSKFMETHPALELAQFGYDGNEFSYVVVFKKTN